MSNALDRDRAELERLLNDGKLPTYTPHASPANWTQAGAAVLIIHLNVVGPPLIACRSSLVEGDGEPTRWEQHSTVRERNDGMSSLRVEGNVTNLYGAIRFFIRYDTSTGRTMEETPSRFSARTMAASRRPARRSCSVGVASFLTARFRLADLDFVHADNATA